MTDESPLNDVERDVVTLAALANPLPLDVIATVLDLGATELSEIVDRLGEDHVLQVDRRGVTAAPIDTSPARRSMLASQLLSALDDRGAGAGLTAAAAWAGRRRTSTRSCASARTAG